MLFLLVTVGLVEYSLSVAQAFVVGVVDETKDKLGVDANKFKRFRQTPARGDFFHISIASSFH